MPQVNGDRSAAVRLGPSRRTPALTSANNGRITNDTAGPTAVWRRSLIEIESRSDRLAARAYREFGDCRKARICWTARSTGARSGVKTGMSSATATPARVGCIPAMYSAIHNAAPSTAYAGPCPFGR